jgi:hypothetical protein
MLKTDVTKRIRGLRKRADQTNNRGATVIDAADRFQAKRQEAEFDRAAEKFVPSWIDVQSANENPPLPGMSSGSVLAQKPKDAIIRVLKPRIELDETQVFILAKNEVILDKLGVRCIPFTVIPAPRDPDDVREYLAPYFLRGWNQILFCDAEEPDLPCVLQKQDDPYKIFMAAINDPSIKDPAAYFRPSGYPLYHFVPDPLG